MQYQEALNQIIETGIAAVHRDYAGEDRKHHREGALLGFNECRGKIPAEIAALLTQANARCEDAFREQAKDYWFWRCRAAEIEWVANVISAILMNQGMPVIVQPTCRGMMMAAAVVEVAHG